MAKTERRNVNAPPDWWIAFEDAAKKSGKASAWLWLRDLGYEQLPKKVQAGLSTVRGVGRPKLPEQGS